MTEDFYRRIDGVREPDPTLGKNIRRLRRPAVEPVALPVIPAPEPEPQVKPKRQRVVLADPRQPTTSLRARVELEEQTSWGELLIKDLVKAQFRTGMWLAALVVVVLGSLPLAFYLAPAFASASVIGVPLAWLLLGVLPFPLLFGAGLWYNRLAERHERDFVDMIEN
ncbi:hypothetical protein [Amycolatopsis anabasis]|uniref:hypothetical protein n=1 Tax=Amycolatopsis anabasis TaxID=1840409 RepID=UPI00131E9689|nr:hypothetical protein [Amycolatopsis anabasis]